MDTRSKILDWTIAERRVREVSASEETWKIVTGYFDPLLAAHVRRLAEIAHEGHRVLVIVTHPEDPILAAADRAVLVAALAQVDAVTVAPEVGLEELLGDLPEDCVVREEDADRRRSAEFAASVRSKAKLEATK